MLRCRPPWPSGAQGLVEVNGCEAQNHHHPRRPRYHPRPLGEDRPKNKAIFLKAYVLKFSIDLDI